jgi:hypothetical protein
VTVVESASRPPGLGGVERFIGAVAAARRWIVRLALAAAVAAAVLAYAILRDGFPDGGGAALAVIGIVAAVAPPVILSAFWLALRELVRLPERFRRLPFDAREHGEQLRVLADRARSTRGNRFQLGRVLWQLGRTTASARETLTPYAPLLPLLSIPFLAATAVAVVAAAIEILVACVVALVLLIG